MSAMSRRKGARAEVDVVNWLRSVGSSQVRPCFRGTMTVAGRCVNSPGRGLHLAGGAVMAQRTPLHRFWSTVDRDGPGGCWVWPVVDRRSGYGRMGIDYRHVYTHRFAFETFNGAIPEGHVVDHLCRNRACCNPSHLEAVTIGENTARGMARPMAAALCRSISRCPHGHPYDETNTYWNVKGRRSCRACARRRGNGVTSLWLCRSCGKRNAGTRYPSSDVLEPGENGVSHRVHEGQWLCSLPLSRKVWTGVDA